MSVTYNTNYRLVVRNATTNKEWEFELENQLEDDSKFYKFQITIPDDMIPSEYQYMLYDPDGILVNQGLMKIIEKEDEITTYENSIEYNVYESDN